MGLVLMKIGLIFSIYLSLLMVICKGSYDERIEFKDNKIYIKYEHQLQDKSTDFQQIVDASKLYNVKPSSCSNNIENLYCLQWNEDAELKINRVSSHCEYFEYKTTRNIELKVTFNIANIRLYGGGEQSNQSWPMDTQKFTRQAFISNYIESQAVLESYWLTSSGFYLYVDEETPLFITLDREKNIFEIAASTEYPYYRGSITHLKYRVCKFENMKEAHKHAIANVLGKPSGIPDFRMIQMPVWSTWAKYKVNISEAVVLDFANSIIKYDLPNSQLEIDDKWETCYGSLTIDKSRFPDMKELVNRLKDKGFRVTIWIHPFVNLDCEPYFSKGMEYDFFVKDGNGSVKTNWWNGQAAYVDFTNPAAADWWYSRLKKLQTDTGIDSFKFDAGECQWSPVPSNFRVMRYDHPETILKAYVRTVAQMGNMIEVRVGRNTQSYPIFIRMIDRETKWKGNLSLPTMIPELLHMNIIGYPFVLPDMIGGNGYNGDIVTEEMFLRWLQINVFMPTLQFSYPPWEFSTKVLELTKKFIQLHEKYSEKIREAMVASTKTGDPVNAPIWWIDPTDPVTYDIDSEFLLGSDILVAPVVEEGAKYRDIYLPKGLWKDENNNKTLQLIQGPKWLKKYPADLDVLPFFSKVEGAPSSAAYYSPILAFIIPLITLTFIK